MYINVIVAVDIFLVIFLSLQHIVFIAITENNMQVSHILVLLYKRLNKVSAHVKKIKFLLQTQHKAI